jgi:rhamnosyl/mannosyltransferase
MSHPALAPEPSCSEEKGSAPLQVLAVGRLTYYKGFEYLIRAAATLEDVQVHLVGKGEEEIALKALANQLGVGQKVVFHGPLPEEQLARLFTRTDCVCLPSIERTEAFGLVLLEAMYYGKATVIADVPGSGMSWIVDDGITGIKTPSGNITELAAALQSLSTNRDKLHALGRNGKSKFDRCFHIDRSAGELIRLYSRVLDQN